MYDRRNAPNPQRFRGRLSVEFCSHGALGEAMGCCLLCTASHLSMHNPKHCSVGHPITANESCLSHTIPCLASKSVLIHFDRDFGACDLSPFPSGPPSFLLFFWLCVYLVSVERYALISFFRDSGRLDRFCIYLLIAGTVRLSAMSYVSASGDSKV